MGIGLFTSYESFKTQISRQFFLSGIHMYPKEITQTPEYRVGLSVARGQLSSDISEEEYNTAIEFYKNKLKEKK